MTIYTVYFTPSQIFALSSTWVNYSLSFNADNYPLAAGKQLGIELQNISSGYMQSYAGVDNVVLLAPEPITLVFLSFGGLLTIRRKH
jgi:hypothetical protein